LRVVGPRDRRFVQFDSSRPGGRDGDRRRRSGHYRPHRGGLLQHEGAFEPQRFADRDGFVLGDGGAIVVLESLEHAERRGARILGEVLGYGSSGDAYHITSPAENGEGAQRAMRACLADGRIDPKDVGYINAHGTSTEQGDIAETEAVKAVFGQPARKLIFGSTKSMTGHLLGAAGALEFGVSLLAATCGVIPPTINQFTPDPQCDLDCAPNRRVERRVDVALSNSFGFGGHNVTLAVRRWE
jgi:3-oxoacyl-[acyl-carrier-protein] synthase II